MSSHGYRHPALTTDIVLFALGHGDVKVLLIERGKPPFQGTWAFPGGFIDLGESPYQAACRELEEETAVRDIRLEQLRVFGEPGRDPRGHTVTVVYLGVIGTPVPGRSEAGSDAARARWWPVYDLPTLAFDHAKIMEYALRRLRTKLACASGDGSEESNLPEHLSLGDVRAACSAVGEALKENTCQ